MYVLTLIMLGMVILGIGIRELILLNERDIHVHCLDMRMEHLGELQVQ
jgi:hypothetical protein